MFQFKKIIQKKIIDVKFSFSEKARKISSWLGHLHSKHPTRPWEWFFELLWPSQKYNSHKVPSVYHFINKFDQNWWYLLKKNLSNQSHENKESNSVKSTNPFSILQKDWGCTLEKGGMKFDKKNMKLIWCFGKLF